MTKKHFEALAAWMRVDVARVARCVTGNVQKELARSLASRLRSFNPHFDADRFVQACLEEP